MKKNASSNGAVLSTNDILAQVAAKKITPEEAAALIDKANQVPLRLSVSEKGGISVYGLGRFPTTLYAEQWQRLIPFTPEISKFIAANRDKLSFKKAAA